MEGNGDYKKFQIKLSKVGEACQEQKNRMK